MAFLKSVSIGAAMVAMGCIGFYGESVLSISDDKNNLPEQYVGIDPSGVSGDNLNSEISQINVLLARQQDQIQQLILQNTVLSERLHEQRLQESSTNESVQITEAIISAENPVADPLQTQQQAVSDFYAMPQDQSSAMFVSNELSHTFTTTPELLDASFGEVDCRGKSCMVQIYPPIAGMTDDELFMFQFHLTSALGAAGLTSGYVLDGGQGHHAIEYQIMADLTHQ